jgi:hypothetical protein
VGPPCGTGDQIGLPKLPRVRHHRPDVVDEIEVEAVVVAADGAAQTGTMMAERPLPPVRLPR